MCGRFEFSVEEKRNFKRKGFVVLEDAIERDVIENARSEIWNKLPCEPHEAPEELKGTEYFNLNNVRDEGPFAEIRKSVFDAAEALVGENVLKPPSADIDIPEEMQIAINCPSADPFVNHVARRIDTAHIDGYGRSFRNPDHEYAGTYNYFTLGSGIYLNSVKDGGGGFTVFPGSHWIAAEYFKTHSLESPGWTGQLPAIDDSGDGNGTPVPGKGWDYSRTLDQQLVPYEISGPPGTIVLWHYKLMHGNAVNHRETPRIATFTRYTNKEGESIKRDAANKLWKYWGDLSEVQVDINENPICHTDCFDR